ncbi:SMP-30/gluconolactonase/LRE family protein [Herbaspirillum rhizosphaerae]|uniref:SMP-30/gluconolactonase/LRE family protein n=1 Tax=Herbaspirillum rhizosphaerae TaxID=346179 RepID=UPI00067BBE05|nr:SMP-30/gluconolactonase/LRE family protein [Herbaspirillum rhizosphaerae]
MFKWLAGFVLTTLLASGAFAGSPNTDIVADGLGFPEGTIVVNGALYFVDYQASTVNKLNGSSYATVAKLPGCGANGLVAANGSLLVACYDSGAIEKISLNGARLGTIKHSRSGERFSHPNDLVTNDRGDVYFTASGDRPGEGQVFLLPHASDVPQKVADGIDNANGIAVSPDGKILYMGESGADRILRYRINDDGTLDRPKIFAQLDSLAPPSSTGRHTPDGIRVGPHGLIYVALFNGDGCWVLNAKGEHIKTIEVPGAHHSNLAISVAEQVLYVTSISSSSGRIYRMPLPAEIHENKN